MCEMRNSSLLGKITVLVIICSCSFSAHAKYGGGSGTADDPYLIYTAEQMNAIGADAYDWDKHFKLMADIDLSAYTGTSFKIIGTHWRYVFRGTFDGNSHTISNFSYTSTGTNYIGLFGFVRGSYAEIKNLELIYPNVDAGTKEYVGSLVGFLQEGTISNCNVEGGSVSGDRHVGGLVGRNYRGTITNCSSGGSVLGSSIVGGLAGDNWGTISNSYSTGSVSGTGWCVGGLVAYNAYYSTITNCYSTASVSGDESVGGLVGDGGIITNCYATGGVIGNRYVGGLVGTGGITTDCYSKGDVLGDKDVGGLVGNSRDTISNCYSAGSVSGDERVGGLVGSGSTYVVSSYWDIETSGQAISDGGKGKTTAQMMMASTFFYWGACDEVWTINEGVDYPKLAWEEKPGEPIVGTFPLQGEGNSNSPYLIHTPEQLNVVGLLHCVWDKHFKLMADIDLSQYRGTEFNIITNFSGVFDGNGHTISNFTYDSNGVNFIGLFGYFWGAYAEIKDLGLIDPNVDAGTGSDVGSLVGEQWDGTITECYVEGGSVSGNSRVGGLVGENFSATITNCYVMGSVTGEEQVGGLVGQNRSGTISNSYSTATAIGNEYVGGLVGMNQSDITKIENCYATGSVTGYRRVGGLVGAHGGTISNCYSTGSVEGVENVGGLVGTNGDCYETWCYPGMITNCYSTGSVVGSEKVGGLVGWNYWGTVLASFWDTQTCGQDWSDGGTGLSTEEMQIQVTFTDAGWDFVGETVNGIEDIWFIPQQDYPHLWWEGMQVPMELRPRTLNCRSKGNWVKAHITLPEGFTVADVDPDRPAVLHSFGFESAPLHVFVSKDKLVEIEAAFERETVCSLAGDWPEELTVAGFLADGSIFLGTSTLRMITPGMK